MKPFITLLILSRAAVSAGTLFAGGYPDWIMVIDENQGKVVEKIHLTTGLPQKIVKTVEQPANEAGRGGGGGGGRNGGGFEVSPDGKFLYEFGSTVTVMNSSDFSVAQKIELAQPDGSAMENLGLGGLIEALSEPGQHVSVFNFADPIVHNRVFGLAHFDLDTRRFDFTPMGPAPVAMTGLHVTPDKKMGFTVTTNGTLGNKRCEIWGIDLGNSKLAHTGEIPCRSRYTFGMSSDGRKLYMYGAGFEIDVYDAATFNHEATWDLNNDITGAVVVLP